MGGGRCRGWPGRDQVNSASGASSTPAWSLAPCTAFLLRRSLVLLERRDRDDDAKLSLENAGAPCAKGRQRVITVRGCDVGRLVERDGS